MMKCKTKECMKNDRNDDPVKNQGADDSSNQENATKDKSYAEALKAKLLTMRQNSGYNLRQTATKAKSFKRRFDRLHFLFLQFQSKAFLTKRTGKQIAEYVQSQILLTQMSAKKKPQSMVKKP